MRPLKPYSPSAVCYLPYFYGEKTGQKDQISQEIETHFDENIEDPLGKMWPQLLERLRAEHQPISADDKFLIASFMAHMWLRNPSMRDRLNNAADTLYRHAIKAFFFPSNYRLQLISVPSRNG